jgi:hypothetical protein
MYARLAVVVYKILELYFVYSQLIVSIAGLDCSTPSPRASQQQQSRAFQQHHANEKSPKGNAGQLALSVV